MRFIHITDTHIGPTPTYRVMQAKTFPLLQRLVESINELPFMPDFILHTGDVTDDGSTAAYELARSVLHQLKAPVFYLVGNHDNPLNMQRVLLGKTTCSERYDYYVKLNGTGLAVFDTRGPSLSNPAGTMTPSQLDALRDLCTPNGPPLIIALHHQPVLLDVQWLDRGWKNMSMLLDCHEAFQKAIAPARERIRGVFFGHVHRSSEVLHNGVLFSTPPSACMQIAAWPTQPEPVFAPQELPGFNIVTITPEQTTIRQHTISRTPGKTSPPAKTVKPKPAAKGKTPAAKKLTAKASARRKK